MVGRLSQLGVAAAALLLAVGAGAAPPRHGVTFADPAGDASGGPGPDLTAVTLSHTSSTVRFTVRFAKAPPLAASARGRFVDMLLIGIDVPPRGLWRGVDGWTGADYWAGLHGGGSTAVLVRVPKAPGPARTVARPVVTTAGRTITFSVSRRALGNPRWLELVLAAGREGADETGGSDEAPNFGVFHYDLSG